MILNQYAGIGYSKLVNELIHVRPKCVVFAFGQNPLLQYVGVVKGYDTLVLSTLIFSHIRQLDPSWNSPLYRDLYHKQMGGADPLCRPIIDTQRSYTIWIGDEHETITVKALQSRWSSKEFHVTEVNPAEHGLLKFELFNVIIK